MGVRPATGSCLAGVLGAAAVALAGCLTVPLDGGQPPGEVAEQAARRLGDDFGRRDRVRTAEYIAATEVPAGAQDNGQVRMTPLAWSGRVFGDETATIDVRFVVTAGDAAGGGAWCYRYTLEMYRYTEHREIRCPAGTPPVPSASPPPALPPDAEDRLAAALRDATPATLARRVRAAFPPADISVDTVTYRGTLVAAVGLAAERDCIVMIRTAGGKPERVAFDQIQLEPGESGCGTVLYTHPVR
ncbi:hypothetical protein [Actinoplanes teichomyceticus]|uniref:Lipoprotein n=1 Tax=Actinoplanes teichomyceticus TaxID=1867 RepID=A0A561VI64_ACTTI|nr:hypothetical protein [Actinoplanes teichomyceticus]TWG11305.1 hypothetical protein FHX34_10635 [Actinoplanes teichomyceticus]GIF16336.1 hypothetical protein Ate01nite_63680 [Actinoplanes teichomyceticus]